MYCQRMRNKSDLKLRSTVKFRLEQYRREEYIPERSFSQVYIRGLEVGEVKFMNPRHGILNSEQSSIQCRTISLSSLLRSRGQSHFLAGSSTHWIKHENFLFAITRVCLLHFNLQNVPQAMTTPF